MEPSLREWLAINPFGLDHCLEDGPENHAFHPFRHAS